MPKLVRARSDMIVEEKLEENPEEKKELSDNTPDQEEADIEEMLRSYVLPFGKYKGQQLKDVDRNYLKYLCSLPDFNNDFVIEYVKTIEDEPYKFRFGKYKNKTLDFVWNKDKPYLYYIAQDWNKDKQTILDFIEQKQQ